MTKGSSKSAGKSAPPNKLQLCRPINNIGRPPKNVDQPYVPLGKVVRGRKPGSWGRRGRSYLHANRKMLSTEASNRSYAKRYYGIILRPNETLENARIQLGIPGTGRAVPGFTGYTPLKRKACVVFSEQTCIGIFIILL